jgi:hypothetical protein
LAIVAIVAELTADAADALRTPEATRLLLTAVTTDALSVLFDAFASACAAAASAVALCVLAKELSAPA